MVINAGRPFARSDWPARGLLHFESIYANAIIYISLAEYTNSAKHVMRARGTAKKTHFALQGD